MAKIRENLIGEVWADNDGKTVVLRAGDKVPSGVKVEDDLLDGQAPASDGPPPKAGAGSGVDAWKAYAAANGVEVPEDAKRDDIVDALDAAGVLTAAE